MEIQVRKNSSIESQDPRDLDSSSVRSSELSADSEPHYKQNLKAQLSDELKDIEISGSELAYFKEQILPAQVAASKSNLVKELASQGQIHNEEVQEELVNDPRGTDSPVQFQHVYRQEHETPQFNKKTSHAHQQDANNQISKKSSLADNQPVQKTREQNMVFVDELYRDNPDSDHDSDDRNSPKSSPTPIFPTTIIKDSHEPEHSQVARKDTLLEAIKTQQTKRRIEAEKNLRELEQKQKDPTSLKLVVHPVMSSIFSNEPPDTLRVLPEEDDTQKSGQQDETKQDEIEGRSSKQIKRPSAIKTNFNKNKKAPRKEQKSSTQSVEACKCSFM